MHVNAITEIKPCPREAVQGHQWYTDANNCEPSSSVAIPTLECVAAFFLDSGVLDGRLCLVYRGGCTLSLLSISVTETMLSVLPGYTLPQVWFQDLSCAWFFVASSFTAYFRLMMVRCSAFDTWMWQRLLRTLQMHLGIPRWHYAFTKVGLDPSTQV